MNNNSLLKIAALVVLFHNAHASFYAGINAGINTVSIKKNLVYPLIEPSPTSSSFTNAYTNFHGQLLAGYDFFINSKFKAGFEGNLDIHTGNSTYAIHEWYFNQNAMAKEQLEQSISFFFLPSYQYNQSVRFFVGPGITSSQFKINDMDTAANIGVSGRFQQWINGGSLKAGIATQLINNLELLFSYQFTQYQSISWSAVEPLSEDSLRGSYKPNTNLVLIGLKANLPQQS